MITLRPAQASDEPFLLGLTHRLASFPLPGWRTAHEIDVGDHPAIRTALQDADPGTLLLVALVDEVPRGYIFVTTRVDFFTQEPHGHIEVLAVEADAAGRGIGKALVNAAEAWVQERGYRSMTLNVFAGNEAARAVYDRLGYLPEMVRYRKEIPGSA
ncbi:MAG: GNAT family N-acetyltransferase [Gemmatimonadales bacterium]